MPYVNPIPAIDLGKEFEMQLHLKFDEPLPVKDAKLQTARYILEQTPETLASWLHCLSVKAMYPRDLTSEQIERFGLHMPGTGKDQKDQ